MPWQEDIPRLSVLMVRSVQVLANELKDMCRKHNPVSRHRRIDHGMGAVEMDTGFGSMVVPQARTIFVINNHHQTFLQPQSVMGLTSNDFLDFWEHSHSFLHGFPSLSDQTTSGEQMPSCA